MRLVKNDEQFETKRVPFAETNRDSDSASSDNIPTQSPRSAKAYSPANPNLLCLFEDNSSHGESKPVSSRGLAFTPETPQIAGISVTSTISHNANNGATMPIHDFSAICVF
ncbi:hypothetical protein [Rhodopirellula sallentina]|uniref:Uncharacterized protein n=1 Tax=Rhodopirellula sallentina SM41 TaxID=1263870 RepID=M5U9E2_9BACT|nr:hypothetical protein [Rhodopirellula sallentina]EMI58067.1 hypothetical protein RSSM_00492 [Rhodopirellula sallentina SM41]